MPSKYRPMDRAISAFQSADHQARRTAALPVPLPSLADCYTSQGICLMY